MKQYVALQSAQELCLQIAGLPKLNEATQQTKAAHNKWSWPELSGSLRIFSLNKGNLSPCFVVAHRIRSRSSANHFWISWSANLAGHGLLEIRWRMLLGRLFVHGAVKWHENSWFHHVTFWPNLLLSWFFYSFIHLDKVNICLHKTCKTLERTLHWKQTATTMNFSTWPSYDVLATMQAQDREIQSTSVTRKLSPARSKLLLPFSRSLSYVDVDDVVNSDYTCKGTSVQKGTRRVQNTLRYI